MDGRMNETLGVDGVFEKVCCSLFVGGGHFARQDQ